MSTFDVPSKDPQHVRAGRAGGLATWAPGRRRKVRLDALSPAERELVFALIAAKERAAEAAAALAGALEQAAGPADGSES